MQHLPDQRRYRIAARQDALHFARQNLGDLQHHVVGQHIAGALVLLARDLVAPQVNGLEGVQLAIVERALGLGVEIEVGVGRHFGFDVALRRIYITLNCFLLKPYLYTYFQAYLPTRLVDAFQQIRLSVRRSEQIVAHHVVDIEQIVRVLSRVLDQLLGKWSAN